MNRLLYAVYGMAAVLLVSGCLTVHETKQDQDKIRNALNCLYENQIIDNLIRAANGLPFAQIDYTNATTTVSVTEKGSLGQNQSLQTTRDRKVVGAALDLTRQFTNMWSYGLEATNSNQIALTANPVINNNEVYDAYLQFLTHPGSLIVSCDPPPPGKAHVCRKWDGNYYWVPTEYRYLFLRLALITTFQRGKRLDPVNDFFLVTIEKVVYPAVPVKAKGNLEVKLQASVHNDSGRIELTVDGKTVRYRVVQPPDPDTGPRPEMTPIITIVFDPAAGDNLIKSDKEFRTRLPLTGKLYLDNFRPQAPTSGELLEAVRFQLEQIRLNQIRLQTGL